MLQHLVWCWMFPATTKVAECPQLPLRWLNVPSYPKEVECHSVNSHTVCWMFPATTKVAECPQLPLRWLNVPSYPKVVECHSENSHTVIIHEYTIDNAMYYPTSGCSDQAFNMMIGGHSVNTHTVLYASYPKVVECPQLPWGSWMSQCKCTNCKIQHLF